MTLDVWRSISWHYLAVSFHVNLKMVIQLSLNGKYHILVVYVPKAVKHSHCTTSDEKQSQNPWLTERRRLIKVIMFAWLHWHSIGWDNRCGGQSGQNELHLGILRILGRDYDSLERRNTPDISLNGEIVMRAVSWSNWSVTSRSCRGPSPV